jgi:hypothetical protein
MERKSPLNNPVTDEHIEEARRLEREALPLVEEAFWEYIDDVNLPMKTKRGMFQRDVLPFVRVDPQSVADRDWMYERIINSPKQWAYDTVVIALK